MLEGFPRNTDELEFMAERGLFPDGAIILNAEDSDVISRLLPPKIDRWKERMNKKLEKRRKKKEKAMKKRVSALTLRGLWTVVIYQRIFFIPTDESPIPSDQNSVKNIKSYAIMILLCMLSADTSD